MWCQMLNRQQGAKGGFKATIFHPQIVLRVSCQRGHESACLLLLPFVGTAAGAAGAAGAVTGEMSPLHHRHPLHHLTFNRSCHLLPPRCCRPPSSVSRVKK